MGDFGMVKDKWVCPNDRELALRAKIKTGWSVKTNAANSFTKPEQLNDSEQDVIMKVIQRAETLDKTEQERVGRLVERLDNMKKNAMGNGSSQCVLCADEFGLLGASPLLCNDCKKAVCTKCSVDTISAHKEPLWLCKICAETRETWKKSGAWFYKGLPKYILPGRKPEQKGKYATTSTLGNKAPVDPVVNSPAGSYNAWLQTKGRSSSDKEYTDSSDDELKGGKLMNEFKSGRKQTTKLYSDSAKSDDSPMVTPDVYQQIPKPSTPTSPYVMTDTGSGYAITKEIADDVPEVVPVSYQRDQEQGIFRSPSKSPAELVSHNPGNTWYKPKKGAEESENISAQKPYKGHVRRDSMSSTGSYCNGKARVHSPQHQVMPQYQQAVHSGTGIPQERHAVLRDPVPQKELPSPEGASKRFKKIRLPKFRK